MRVNDSRGVPAERVPLDVAEVLKRGRARIARGWCTGYSSTNLHGFYVHWDDPGVVAWCALGAIGHHPEARLVFMRAIDNDDELCASSVSDWNDAPGRTQADVLDAFDKAIALAES